MLFFTGSRFESAAYQQMYDLLCQVRDKWDIGVLDLWNNPAINDVPADQKALYILDGIHPTKAGYRDWWGPELERQLPLLEREEIARASIDKNGKIIVTDDLKKAIEVANEIAPEHLELCVENPFDWLNEVRHAGSVFMGRNCPEALGDYLAGPNHTLPTSGTARFASPLSVDDFVKKMQFTCFTRDALADVAEDVALFARQEGLTAHARSAVIRTED